MIFQAYGPQQPAHTFVQAALRSALAGQDFDIPQAFTDYREMLSVGLDAVSICTSPRTRAPLLKAAAEAGLPVFCEKPWATDLAHAQELAELCRASEATVMMRAGALPFSLSSRRLVNRKGAR